MKSSGNAEYDEACRQLRMAQDDRRHAEALLASAVNRDQFFTRRISELYDRLNTNER